MKTLALLFLGAALAGCGTGVRTKTELSKTQPERFAARSGQVCLMAGGLPEGIETVAIGKVKATKGEYGETEQLMPAIATEARRVGADAVINLQAKIAFKGPMPWRVAAPTGAGTAVHFVDQAAPFDCIAAGGRLF